MSSNTDTGRRRTASLHRSGARGGDVAISTAAENLDVAEPTIDDVFRVVFGLGDIDVRTYETVEQDPGATTSELAARLDRDRSNVNRSLNRLRDAGLVTRGRQLLDGGGHVYQYYVTSGHAQNDVTAAPTADGAETAPSDVLVEAIERWRSAAIEAVNEL